VFYALWFTPFYFDAPCQFTTIFNLRSLIFGLMLSGSFLLGQPLISDGNMFHLRLFLFTPTLTGKQVRRKKA
jgi:hypothetical protein